MDQVQVEGRWHVALVERECGGAILFPVVAWMKVEDGDPLSRGIIPYFYDGRPGGNETSLTSVNDVDEDDFLGIVPPGEEIGSTWDDLAEERVEQERAEDEKKEREKRVAEYVEKHTQSLPWSAVTTILYAARDRQRVDDTPGGVSFHLATHGMIEAHRMSSGETMHTWCITEDGLLLLEHAIKRTR